MWWGRRDLNRGPEMLVEFKSRSRHFKKAQFLKIKPEDYKKTLLVCWDDNWEECPVDVLELKYFWEKAQEK
jgi:hypothetical protein